MTRQSFSTNKHYPERSLSLCTQLPGSSVSEEQSNAKKKMATRANYKFQYKVNSNDMIQHSVPGFLKYAGLFTVMWTVLRLGWPVPLCVMLDES